MNNLNYITATDARKNFFELLENVKRRPTPVNITVKGIPEAVIMSREDYDSWIATIETLSDPELMDQIRESDADFKAGRYENWEDVKRELGFDYVSSKIKQAGKKRTKKA